MFNPKENILDKQLAESGKELQFLDFVADVFTGGAHSRNKQARKQAKEQNKADAAAYKFEGEELQRSYEYSKESLEIQKRNTEANISFQEKQLKQQYDYGMGIRAYEYNQELRAYDQSFSEYTQQTSFNTTAEEFALQQQDRYLLEQQIDLALDEDQTYLQYATATRGLQLQKQKAVKAAAKTMRDTGLEELRAAGAARARGKAGRSQAKILQSITAEYDRRESDLIDTLMLDVEGIDLELMSKKMQLDIDQFAFEMTSNNLLAADQFSRKQIAMQRRQADMQAEANLMLKPEQVPPLPKPIALPRPEYQEVYEPKQGPPGAKVIAPQESLGAALVSTTLGYATVIGGLTSGGGSKNA